MKVFKILKKTEKEFDKWPNRLQLCVKKNRNNNFKD